MRLDFEIVAPFLDEWDKERAAVCCWNDQTAYNLLHECAARRIKVPQQLAVAGFDGFLDKKMPGRQLTTIGCPWPDVASHALSLLVELIEGRDGDAMPREMCLPVTLLEGDTV